MDLWAWCVFLAATLYTIWDGVRRTRGAKDLEGFFAAGRSIPWWAAGLSVMATQLSAITILGGVGMGYENGLEWVQFYFALPFAMIILCIWFVPAYRRHPILTAYEFLERRFGPITRSLTSLTFLLSRCLAFAVVLYAPAVVFAVMTGLPIGPTVWITGLATTAYTVVGGTGGVVWTDVKQMLLIFVGIVLCLGFLLFDATGQLGLGGTMRALGAAGKLNPVEVQNAAWTFVPVAVDAGSASASFWADKYNIWTGLFGTIFLFLSYFGCDQSQVQSVLTSKSVDASRRAMLVSAFTKVPLQLMVLLLGGLLYLNQSLGQEPLLYRPADRAVVPTLEGDFKVRYETAAAQHKAATAARSEALQHGAAEGTPAAERAFRAAVAAAATARKDAQLAIHAQEVARQHRGEKFENDSNYIFPDYLFTAIPKPLLGLMLAAIFAAAISSAAGALSSLTSATMIDFYRRWLRPAADERTLLRHSRIVMAVWGIAATIAATEMGGGPLLERVNEIGSMFYGSILGVFALALFVPRASGTAASCGLVGGLLSVAAVHQTLQIAYLWDNLVGAIGAVGVGLVVSWIAPRSVPVEPDADGAVPHGAPSGWTRTYVGVAVLATITMALLWALSAFANYQG